MKDDGSIKISRVKCLRKISYANHTWMSFMPIFVIQTHMHVMEMEGGFADLWLR